MLSQKETESSVREINEKCEEMCSDADSYGRIDLHDYAALVRQAVAEMNEEFDKNGPGTQKLSLLKKTVERRAVVLEYYLQAVCEKYREKYQLRVYIDEFMRKVSERVSLVARANDDDDTDKVLWASYGGFALGIKQRSLKLLFDLSSEERAMMDEIVKNF